MALGGGGVADVWCDASRVGWVGVTKHKSALGTLCSAFLFEAIAPPLRLSLPVQGSGLYIWRRSFHARPPVYLFPFARGLLGCKSLFVTAPPSSATCSRSAYVATATTRILDLVVTCQ